MRTIFALLGLAACSPEKEVEPCPEGSTRAADGLCYLDDAGDAGDAGGDENTDEQAEDEDGGDEEGTDVDVPETDGSVAFLGGGSHSLDAVSLTVIATADHGLVAPRDLAFDPFDQNQLWVVDRHDDAMVILSKPGSESMTAWRSSGMERDHWLAQPSALAFGAEGFLATAHDSDGMVPGDADPSFAMGPSLWPSDLLAFDGGRPSHLDMVHDPALSQGIAWEQDNVYWVHDGWNGCLTRLDFDEPHEPGGVYHSDADVDRHVCGEVGYLEGVPAHMEWDPETERLWFADPELGTVSVLDPSTGTEDRAVPGTDDASRHEWVGSTLTAVVSGEPLVQPSGLELYEDLVLISDPATSLILAFAREDGALVDWLDTELPAGSLAGITIGPDGALWLVDVREGRVLRLAGG